MSNPMSRREFLGLSLKTLTAFGLTPLLFNSFAEQFVKGDSVAPTDPVLVVIQLTGGNDGLNTIIPYGIGAYYDARPTIGYKQNEVIPINNTLAFQKSLKGLSSIYGDGKLAIIQNVGYPDSSRSHFEAQEIWQTSSPNRIETTGWVGRYTDLANEKKDPLFALTVGATTKSLDAKNLQYPRIDDPRAFKFVMHAKADEIARRDRAISAMYKNFDRGLSALTASDRLVKTSKYQDPTSLYPSKYGFSQRLSFIAQCISSGLPTKAYVTELEGGFDEHESERNSHARVLSTFDENLYAFYQDLRQRNVLDRVVIVVYSEFGRRVHENASGGTDHGTANSVFVIGGKVKGGLYGDLPNFHNLDAYGDFKYGIDFRSVFGTLAESWMGVPSKSIMFGKTYETLPIF